MNQFVNEDVAWQRLKDLQLEMENSRLFATQTLPALVLRVKQLGRRIWWLGGLATGRAPRRHPVAGVATLELEGHETGSASDAA